MYDTGASLARGRSEDRASALRRVPTNLKPLDA
jgi:hypothetical protein